MSNEHKRKFRLGDIIRKMNEYPASSDDGGDAAHTPKKEEPVSSTRLPGIELPLQPSYKENTGKTAPAAANGKPAAGPESGRQTDSEPRPAPIIKAEINGSQPPFHPPAKPPESLPMTQTSDADEEEEFDIFRYISVIIRRKEIVLLATVVMAFYSLFSYLRSTRYYTATARLLFKPYEENIIDQPSSWRFGADRERNFNTHLELLKSDIVLERVSQSLGNTIRAGAIAGGLRIAQGETEGKENDIVELRFKYTEAETARDVLNELCKLYIDYIREVNAQEDTRLIVKLKTQIDKVQNELTFKENDLRRFKENNTMVELSKETNLQTTKLSTMELALQQTQLDLLESKERLTTLKAQISQQEINIVQSMTYQNPTNQRIGELELELNTLSGEYSPDHFKIKQITQQIENLKQVMQNEIKKEVTSKAVSQTLIKNPIRESLLHTYVNQTVEISALETKRIAQEQIIEKLTVEMKKLPLLEQEYAFLERETESLLKTLKMLKMKLEETKIKRDAKESDIKILELAKLPMVAFSGKKASSIFVGMLIGLIIGIALAFLLEYLDQSLKDPSDVERNLDLPLIGIVPLIEAENAIVKDENLTKSVLEPFRALRANIKHIASQHNAKSFMMCSAVKGEGKTTLAVNLGITFAMDGKKVMIIDCDLRRSQIHHLLNVPKKNGLSDYLANPDTTLDAIVKTTVHENLFAITSGERPDNPSELLGIPRFHHLINELKNRVDIIICDSPALIPVSDSMTMAPHMDCCIMVFRALWTPMKAARQAKNQLVRIGAKLGGGIYNGISQSRGYYPYYYGYYGYYAYKYSYDYDKEPKKKFSVREFGLTVEKRMKTGIRSMPMLVSRYSLMGIALTRILFRETLFWLLLALLVGVITIRYLLFPKTGPEETQNSESELITFIGEHSNTTEPQNRPITVVGRQDSAENYPAETGNAFEKTGQFNPGNPAQPLFAFAESLSVLVRSLNIQDTSRVLSLYSRDDFKYPGGGYSEWSAELIKNGFAGKTIISVENAFAEKIDADHQKTVLSLKMAYTGDTLDITKTLMWKNRNNAWRIVREKE